MLQFSGSVQTWNVRQAETDLFQAETDLFQAVTMATIVLHGVHLMYAWRTFHV